MPTGTAPMVGLRPVTGPLLERMIERPGGRSRRLPIVVALGPRGSGKTALLRAIEHRCANVPHVYLDFDRNVDIDGRDHLPPREVLGTLALVLSRHTKQFGRLAFPRLWLCLMVVGSSVRINAGDRRQALTELRRLLAHDQPIEENREAVVRLVEFAGGQQLPGWAGPVTDRLLSGLGWFDRWRVLRRIEKLSSAQGKAEDVLIDIAGWADNRADESERAQADAIFYEAFLSDLRRAYRGVNRLRRTANCVVLLDNVHTMGGQRFLLDLQQAMQRGNAANPLAVFATSGAWIPYWNEGWHQPGGHYRSRYNAPLPPIYQTGTHIHPAPRRSADIDDDWRRADPDDIPWRPWYLIELSRLTKPEVAKVAAGFGQQQQPGLAEFVHRLTTGHPAGVAEILTTVTADTLSASPADLRKVLDLPWPHAEHDSDSAPTASAHAFRELLQAFDATAQNCLVTASAARNLDLLYRPDVVGCSAPDGERTLEQLRNTLWIRESADLEPDFEFDPWLRRILLHTLALRDNGDPRNWTRTHTMCRDLYQREGRLAAALYHDLALENLDAAIEHLRGPLVADIEFTVPAAQTWLADLDFITSAPNRPNTAVSPRDRVSELVGSERDELDTSLGRLIAALWITHDPLADPQRTLHTTITSEFRHIALTRGGAVLLYAGERYELQTIAGVRADATGST